MHKSTQQRVKVVILQRPLFPTMHLRRVAFAQALIAVRLPNVASAASVSGRVSAVASPDDQLLAVRDQCFEFKLEGSILTAFCAFQGTIPAKASVDLNDCIENSSGEMLFVKG